MKNYKIYKNIISNIECNILNNWILENKDTPIFKEVNMGGIRRSTRFTESDSFKFPKLAYELQERIISILNLKNFIFPPYKDGMVVSYALPGDTCYEHKDPQWDPNKKTIHCNIALTNFEGGEPYIENEIITNFNQRDMICYTVSEVNHGSQLITGNISRNLWIFGFCV